ncbi:hypothetical protein [Cryobacterium sp. Y82]|uniref:DUF7657 domain-containing protein n=1 Tax=Cryobacterium sp. Y82 TaxID=2045017 RepID=UPI0011B0558E|nr:hypothetical protein [Cryobacterium sp. Y82]
MTVLNELPSWDWSSLFRPHMWGYLLFGLDAGVAWQWWIPALALVSGCYVFVVSLLPRRPLTAALIALALFFTPMLQWFYTPSSFWPVAWPLLAMTALVWILNDKRRWVRYFWAVLTGYTAVTMAMGLYVPFIIPGMMVFLAFAIGYLFRVRQQEGATLWTVLARLAPLAVAGLAALAVTGIWAATRFNTFSAIQNTVYPGQRVEQTGALLSRDPLLTGIAGAPWNESLKSLGITLLGGNSSEGSSVILLCVFVLPGLLWFALRSLGRKRDRDWLLISSLVGIGFIVAYLFVPGWDALAQLMQFSRVPVERFRIGLIVLLPLVAVLTIEQVGRSSRRLRLLLALLCSGTTAALLLSLWFKFKTLDPNVLAYAPSWKIVAVLLVSTVFFLFLRRGAVLAAACLLTVSLLISWGVNPIYKGVYDLSSTEIGLAVHDENSRDKGTWIGTGTYETMAVLVQTGVPTLSGVQTYPPKEMWEKIDPSAKFEDKWNRLARVVWTLKTGAMTVDNPAPDVIEVTVDPCSQFAQENIKYVLSDIDDATEECLVPTQAVQQGARPMQIFEVVPFSG